MGAQDEQFSRETKKTLRILTISLIVDLIAFACILPLFPSIIEHYRVKEADQPGLFHTVLGYVTVAREYFQLDAHYDAVLLGGLLGSLFSLLQFLTAPMIGHASDIYGRRPALLLSTLGTAMSYTIWLVSSSFELFVLSRVIGGLTRGNIHLLLAVVSDITTPGTRNKGMMYVGISFSIGFIFGPLVGAFFSKVDLTTMYPALTSYGLNTFSLPALFSLTMCLLNWMFLYFYMEETLPKDLESTKSSHVTASEALNPFTILGGHLDRQVRWINAVYFLFLFIYSGLEFTLSFLVHERFHYTNMQQGRLLAFIGIITSMIQGGYVRRKGGKERRLALQGMCTLVGGLLLIGYSQTQKMLYCGAVLLAFTSGTVVTCLTALATMHTAASNQGYVVGILRASGALARALGPMC
eukprot:Ihof_evm3s196 gene=Ihof_evmTU3s196